MYDMFYAYAKHEQEKQDIIERICNGMTTIDVDDDFSSNDLRDIEQEVYRRTGIVCHLS